MARLKLASEYAESGSYQNQGGFHQKEKSLLKMMQLHYPVTCLLLNIDIHQCEKLGKNELLYLSELVPTDRPKIATSQLGFK